MLDFSGVRKTNPVYNILYDYVGVILRTIFFRRFQVTGRHNVPPKDEGFLVICNHQNGLVDALSVIFSIAPHKPVFIARADIFKKDWIGRLLRMLRIMPAFRARDTGRENLDKNDIIFKQSVKIMQEGGVVALFPEAGHQDHHCMGTFKKGFARIAFGYEEACNYEKNLKILPLGHDYSGYFGMQNDVLISVAEPFTFEELYDTYKQSPERGRYLLAAKARERVDNLILDIEDYEDIEAIEQLCDMYIPGYLKKHHLKENRLKNHLAAKRELNAALKSVDYGRERPLREGETAPELTPEQKRKKSLAADLIAKATKYVENLKALKLDDRIVERSSALGFASRTLLWILLLPVFIVATLINFIPYNLGAWLTRKTKDRMLVPSFELGIGIFSFLIWYLILFAIIWIVFKKFWIALVALLLMPVSLLLYHFVKGLTGRLANRIRKYRYKLGRNQQFEQTRTLRRDIMSGLGNLMA